MPNRKGSAKDQAAEVDSASPSDIASLLRETEDRLMKFFKDEICKVTDRLDRMEKNISSLQCECIRLDNEMTKTREVLIRQQVTIENHEASIRAANLIFHNIPENVVIPLKMISLSIRILIKSNIFFRSPTFTWIPVILSGFNGLERDLISQDF